MNQIPVNAQGVPLAAPVHLKPLPTPPVSHLPPLPPLPQSAVPLPPTTHGPIYNNPPLATQPTTWHPPEVLTHGTVYTNPSLPQPTTTISYNNPQIPFQQNAEYPAQQPMPNGPVYNNPPLPSQNFGPIQGERIYLFTCTNNYVSTRGDHTFSDQNGNLVYKYNYDGKTTYKWLEDASGQRVLTAQGVRGSTLILSIETAQGVVSGTYKRHLFRSQKTLVVDGLSIELTKNRQRESVWTSATGQQMMTSHGCNLNFTAQCSEAVEKAIALAHAFECYITDAQFRSH